MYRIETHLHTTYISHCGWLGAAGHYEVLLPRAAMTPSASPTTTTANASTTPTST